MLSAKSWRADAVARLFLGVLGTYGMGLCAASFAFQGNWADEQSRRFAAMMIEVMCFQGASLMWVHLFLREHGVTWNEAFGFTSEHQGRVVGLGLLAGVGVLPIAWALQQLSIYLIERLQGTPVPQMLVDQLQKGGMSTCEKVVMAVMTLTLAPVAEEVLFRGVLYPAIKQLVRPRLAFWGTAILFGLVHFNLMTFLPLVFFAVILSSLYEVTGNLVAPILAHSCFNAVNFAMLIFAKDLQEAFPRVFAP